MLSTSLICTLFLSTSFASPVQESAKSEQQSEQQPEQAADSNKRRPRHLLNSSAIFNNNREKNELQDSSRTSEKSDVDTSIQDVIPRTVEIPEQIATSPIRQSTSTEIADRLSVAPWVKTTRFNPATGETSGQGVSNIKYDSMLKNSAIDRGFGYATKGDIWERVRNGFALNGYEHPRVDRSLSWFVKRKKYLDRVTERAKPFLYYIMSEIEKRGMPTEIALLPVVESAFQPFAYSHGSAAGLWQFIPATGKQYGLKLSWWYDGRRDVYTATVAALEYLSDLYDHFDGNWLHALAAYNSGQGTVRRAIRKNLKKGKKTDFWSLELPEETRGYVPKLLAISALIADPDAYQVTMKSIPNRPYFERINIESQIDLARAAEMAGMTIEQLYSLNPAFNRWATDPDGPHHLIIPLKNADRFLNNLASLKKEDRIQWQRHQIAAGESLGSIARKYQTTIALLKKINNLTNKQIRKGKSLIIPVATQSLDKYTMTADARLKKLQNRKRNGKKITYKVKPGDSLWEIAQEYDVDTGSLAAWNGMAPKDPLFVGKKLVVWVKGNRNKLKNVSIPTTFAAPTTKATTRRISYQVREGDSLSGISEKFKVTVSDLKKWNSLTEGKYIHPGQKLKLYVDVTRQTENI